MNYNSENFQSVHHHFYFCPNLHGSGVYWGISELLKNKNTSHWSQQFFTMYKFTVTGVCFSSFFISMPLVHCIKPLSPHSMQRRCFFKFEHLFAKYSIGFRLQRNKRKCNLHYAAMSMMTSQILISVDFTKTQKTEIYKERNIVFSSNKKIH